MRKSIGILVGMMAVLSACGAPATMTAPAAGPVMAQAATPGIDPKVERLFETLEAHFQTDAPSVMCLADRKYGPAFGFATIANKKNDQALTEVNVGSITHAGKITTMLSFSSRISRSRNPPLDAATAAIKSHVTGKIGTQIKQFVISSNPVGHDKYAYLAIGTRTSASDPAGKLTWFHAGTYAVGNQQITSITDFGTNWVK
jgi:hypothetical protein